MEPMPMEGGWNPDLVLGAIEIGVLMSSVLYGMTCSQALRYSHSNGASNDALWMKGLVVSIWLLETAHVASIWAYLYHLTITNFGNAQAYSYAPWSFAVALIVQGLLSSSVQAFFTYRAFVLSGKKRWVLVPGWVIAVARAFTIPAMGIMWGVDGLLRFTEHHSSIALASIFLGVAGDLYNSVLIVYFLWNQSRATGRDTTLRFVNKLILWTIETGAVTTLCAILIMVFCMYGVLYNGLWMAIVFIYLRVDSNALLATLNARDRHQALASEISGVSDSRYALSNTSTLKLPTYHFYNSLRPSSSLTEERV